MDISTLLTDVGTVVSIVGGLLQIYQFFHRRSRRRRREAAASGEGRERLDEERWNLALVAGLALVPFAVITGILAFLTRTILLEILFGAGTSVFFVAVVVGLMLDR